MKEWEEDKPIYQATHDPQTFGWDDENIYI